MKMTQEQGASQTQRGGGGDGGGIGRHSGGLRGRRGSNGSDANDLIQSAQAINNVVTELQETIEQEAQLSQRMGRN